MDWRSVTFDWNDARAFLVTAEEGSLSAAARALGLSQPTLGRQVAALEQHFGVTLFERVGRGMTLTAGGLELAEHVRVMGEAANRLSLSASGQSQSIEGSIVISASEAYAAFVLPPMVEQLRRAAPGLSIALVATNALSDLLRREADIAVRNAEPTDPDLIARKIGDDGAHFYATPGYLAQAGRPASLADMDQLVFVGFDDNAPLVDGFAQMGLAIGERHFPVRTGSHLVNWELVKQGLGVGLMPARVGDAEPLVERVLPEMRAIPFPMWLVAHRELNTSRRVRLAFDVLAEGLGAGLAQQHALTSRSSAFAPED